MIPKQGRDVEAWRATRMGKAFEFVLYHHSRNKQIESSNDDGASWRHPSAAAQCGGKVVHTVARCFDTTYIQ